MKKEKREILKERYAGSFVGKKEDKKGNDKILKEGGVAVALSGPRSEEQTNLFGEKDQLYNTIQEEISIVVAMIKACQDAIDKKEEMISALQKRKDNLERAARTAAKMRDEELSKKEKK